MVWRQEFCPQSIEVQCNEYRNLDFSYFLPNVGSSGRSQQPNLEGSYCCPTGGNQAVRIKEKVRTVSCKPTHLPVQSLLYPKMRGQSQPNESETTKFVPKNTCIVRTNTYNKFR